MDPAPKQKRVTITDVAHHAGVSTAAVSKVLRNAYGTSAAMQEKVRAAMAELNYRPHAAARGMRGRTYTIGILLDNIRNPFFADILDGIRDELRQSEYTVLIGAAGFDADDQARTIRSMVDRQMDGIILIAPGSRRSEVLDTAATTPTVVIGHHDPSPRTTPSWTRTEPERAWWSTTWCPWGTGRSPWYQRPEPKRACGSRPRRPNSRRGTWRPWNATAWRNWPRSCGPATRTTGVTRRGCSS